MKTVLAVSLCFVSCSGPAIPAVGSNGGDSLLLARDTSVAKETAFSLPEMPPYPSADPNTLAIVSAGRTDFSGVLPVSAGKCAHPAMLQISATGPGRVPRLDLILLVVIDSAIPVGSYPIVMDDRLFRDPPAARLALHEVFPDNRVVSFESVSGDVEIEDLSDTVTGNFAITVEQHDGGGQIQVAGSFIDLKLTTLSAERCAFAEDS